VDATGAGGGGFGEAQAVNTSAQTPDISRIAADGGPGRREGIDFSLVTERAVTMVIYHTGILSTLIVSCRDG
jgi:hypothetical protein